MDVFELEPPSVGVLLVPPETASASETIECVMAAFVACSTSGTPLLRTSTIVR